MKISIFRYIIIGILLGFLAFVAWKLFIIVFLVGAILRLSGRAKWRKGESRKLAYADKIRSMGDEDFEDFKSNFGNHSCHNYRK
jgi:hypothetical protein